MTPNVFAFEQVPSLGEEDFERCDLCGESGVHDFLNHEMRPFYHTQFFGYQYTVCLNCLDEWMKEPCR